MAGITLGHIAPTRWTGSLARHVLGVAFCSLLLFGCESQPHGPGAVLPAPIAPKETALPAAPPREPAGVEALPGLTSKSPLTAPEIYQGRSVPAAKAEAPIAIAEGGDVTLNFVNSPIREFIDSVLGNTLGLTYVVDPNVQGTITLRTARPLPRDRVLGVVEDALAMNGAALVQKGDAYKVVPLEDAASSPAILQQGGRAQAQLDRGFSLHVIPLRYGSAPALQEVLQPFVPQGRTLRIDPTRNLFIFAGTGPEAADFADLVSIFDVDWMSGKSFGIFPLKYADPDKIASELQHVFGQGSQKAPAASFDVVPIERLNAVLVITPQKSYLDDARDWIARLDRGNEADRRQLFVYYVQNGRAAELAGVLGQAFNVSVGINQETTPQSTLAPGLSPSEMTQPGATQQSYSPSSGLTGNTSFGNTGGTSSFGTESPAGALSPLRQSMQGGGGTPALGVGGGPEGTAPTTPGPENALRIVADVRNNALVMYATPAEYETMLAALKRLDIVPLQVLIEATIAEVTLNNDLKYGLEWFFSAGGSKFVFTPNATSTNAPTPNLLTSTFPGFSYILSQSNARVVLNALSQITDVKVISSPSLMVLDNEPARLQVGDQVPLAVRTSISTEVSTTTAPIVADIEYRDTGVILDIIPRVNAGGLVVLDIIQEVSNVSPTVVNAATTTTTQATTPTISQRRIASTVAINSGDTVALGGLIQDSATKAVSGIPVLSDIPVLGNLFKTTDNANVRTELLVLLTPRVVRDRTDARLLTDQLRQRLRGLAPLSEKIH
jgi:general secretion pathway protein D